MKKFVITLSLLTAALSMVSCDLLNSLKPAAPAPAPAPAVLRVYSNAYDGYVNIRQAPTTKSAILGRLKNGDDFLPQVSVEGNWIAVQYQGTIGYVAKSAAGYNPWKPVYLGVDGNSVQGMYSNGYYAYLVFSNGKFACLHQYGAMYYGTWKFEGMDIIFTTKYMTEYGRSMGSSRIGAEERLPVKSKMIGTLKKETLYSNSHYNYYEGGDLTVSKEDFQAYKKEVNKYVRLN